jgi:hypothetical protein
LKHLQAGVASDDRIFTPSNKIASVDNQNFCMISFPIDAMPQAIDSRREENWHAISNRPPARFHIMPM